MRQTSTLDNRLRIVTESLPGSQSVCIGVLVAAGPQDEPADKAGLAHLAEHSFFLGTSGRDANQIYQLADSTCGNIGAFTGRDYTCFYAHIMRDYRPFAWDLLGDILLNSTFPEDGIASERQVVLQEIGTSEDHPESRLNDILKRSIWPDHPLGRPVAGNASSVAQLTREDIIYFVGQHYVPDRIIVAAVGDIDHESAVGEAQDSFWRMLGSSPQPTHNPCEFASTIRSHTSGASHSYFTLAFPAQPYGADNRYSLHAFNTILGGGLSSRLFTRLRRKLHAVYEIGSSYDAYHAAGALIIQGVTTPDHLTTVLSAALQEIYELAQDGVDEEELHRAKLQIQGQYQLAADSNHTRMSRLLTQQFYLQRTLDDDEILGAIDNVTCNDVQQEAQRMLRTCSPTVVTLSPEDRNISEEELHEAIEQNAGLLSQA